MYPPFWFSMPKSKKAMLILLEGNIKDHYLRRSCHIFQALKTRFPHWIPQPAIWRATLSSLAHSLIPQTDWFTIFHICLRNRDQPNQTSCVSFASKYTASKFATLISDWHGYGWTHGFYAGLSHGSRSRYKNFQLPKTCTHGVYPPLSHWIFPFLGPFCKNHVAHSIDLWSGWKLAC